MRLFAATSASKSAASTSRPMICGISVGCGGIDRSVCCSCAMVRFCWQQLRLPKVQPGLGGSWYEYFRLDGAALWSESGTAALVVPGAEALALFVAAAMVLPGTLLWVLQWRRAMPRYGFCREYIRAQRVHCRDRRPSAEEMEHPGVVYLGNPTKVDRSKAYLDCSISTCGFLSLGKTYAWCLPSHFVVSGR